MSRKLFVAAMAMTIVPFFAVMNSGCAKKPQIPVVEQPAEETPAAIAAPAPSPPPTQPSISSPLPQEQSVPDSYEGFMPVAPPAESSVRNIADISFPDVLFDFDKYDVKWQYKEQLQKMAQALKENADVFVAIEGHCDERGTNAYNRALGVKRANAVQEFLNSMGVMKSRLVTVSYGEEKPLCTEHNENCWDKNRRAHFLLTVSGR